MVIIEADGTAWRTARGSTAQDNHVEIAYVRGRYRMRGSHHRGGPVLNLSRTEFEAFARGVKEGLFDSLRWT